MALLVFGSLAVAAMLLMYALEARSPRAPSHLGMEF